MKKKANQIPPLTESDIRRFFSLVKWNPDNDCVEWQNKPSPGGYGHFCVKGGSYPAHRVACAIRGINVPTDMQVNHRCSNKKCVRADHLEIVDQSGNSLYLRDFEGGAHGQKLDREKVAIIKRKLIEGERRKDVAKQFGVSKETISAIGCGVTWSNVLPELSHKTRRCRGDGSIVRTPCDRYCAMLNGVAIGNYFTHEEAESAIDLFRRTGIRKTKQRRRVGNISLTKYNNYQVRLKGKTIGTFHTLTEAERALSELTKTANVGRSTTPTDGQIAGLAPEQTPSPCTFVPS